ncbi:ABC transporter ATP-binding protein [Streptomyces sp. NPDC002033]|uniref:ABC transporter ATP-binding protein n=1 Tax=unclassified Streptomyces TaxID=2593676 RepID=UPI00332500D5
MSDPTHAPALRATRLGREYAGRPALHACDIELPAGHVTALVGPNGAGKSTLLRLAAGLARPSGGRIRVLGAAPGTAEARRRTAHLAQEKPLHAGFTVADTLRLGRMLNPGHWDEAVAERLVRSGDIPFHARVGSLSGGNRTRVALALVLGKRADLLLLDEPLADLDPLARHEVMSLLMAQAAERGASIVMSSHVLAELEEVCDHVLLLQGGFVRLAGDIQDLCDAHTWLTGRADPMERDGLPRAFDRSTVVHAAVTGRQVTALVRTAPGAPRPVGSDDRWVAETPSLETLLLAHLRTAATPVIPATATAPTAPTAPTAGPTSPEAAA